MVKRIMVALFAVLGLGLSVYTMHSLPRHPDWKHAKQSVVFIDLELVGTDKKPVSGTASGFLVGSDGYIVTVAHAIRTTKGESMEVKISLYGDPVKKYKPLVMYVNTYLDIAVLKIEVDRPLPYLHFNVDAQDGDSLFMVGHPRGFGWSIYPTMLSSRLFLPVPIVDAESDTMQYMFQLSAPMSPGVSGAPVLDTNGRVVCMTHIIRIPSFPGAQINFCVPSEIIVHALEAARVRMGTN